MKVYILNEGAKAVTARDVETAFAEAAELYGGMAEDEARTLWDSRPPESRTHQAGGMRVLIGDPGRTNLNRWNNEQIPFSEIKGLIDGYIGDAGNTMQTLVAYNAAKNAGNLPDLYEIGADGNSRDTDAARYISKKLGCFAVTTYCVYKCVYHDENGFSDYNINISTAWYRGVNVCELLESPDKAREIMEKYLK